MCILKWYYTTARLVSTCSSVAVAGVLQLPLCEPDRGCADAHAASGGAEQRLRRVECVLCMSFACATAQRRPARRTHVVWVPPRLAWRASRVTRARACGSTRSSYNALGVVCEASRSRRCSLRCLSVGVAARDARRPCHGRCVRRRCGAPEQTTRQRRCCARSYTT